MFVIIIYVILFRSIAGGTFNCIGYEQCAGEMTSRRNLFCVEGSNCYINCHGKFSCYYTTFICPTGPFDCIVDCTSTEYYDKPCYAVRLNANQTTTGNLLISSIDSYQGMRYSDIYCPQFGDCNLTISGNEVGYAIEVYGQENTNMVHIFAFGPYHSVVQRAEIHCPTWNAPAGQHNCYVIVDTDINETFTGYNIDNMEIWAEESFSNFYLECKRVNASNWSPHCFADHSGYPRIWCGKGYENVPCYITYVSNNEWICDPWKSTNTQCTNYSFTPTTAPTLSPSATPTFTPSQSPTAIPTGAPSFAPTVPPTAIPTFATMDPTIYPTYNPTIDPTHDPTNYPTYNPTAQPTVPTSIPSQVPTQNPSQVPTSIPTVPTSIPTTSMPSTSYPSQVPTQNPTFDGINCGGIITDATTEAHDKNYYQLILPQNNNFNYAITIETCEGSSYDTKVYFYDSNFAEITSCDDCGDCAISSREQLVIPSVNSGTYVIGIGGFASSYGTYRLQLTCNNFAPTPEPSLQPTQSPTSLPTHNPTTTNPTMFTKYPTLNPSKNPTRVPTEFTLNPSKHPTYQPTLLPTNIPTNMPTNMPTNIPTIYPTNDPTDDPTYVPTPIPTEYPSTLLPTVYPTSFPSMNPSISPSIITAVTTTEDSERSDDGSTIKENQSSGSMSTEIMVIIVVGVIISAIIIAAIVLYFFCSRENKDNMDKSLEMCHVQATSQNQSPTVESSVRNKEGNDLITN